MKRNQIFFLTFWFSSSLCGMELVEPPFEPQTLDPLFSTAQSPFTLDLPPGSYEKLDWAEDIPCPKKLSKNKKLKTIICIKCQKKFETCKERKLHAKRVHTKKAKYACDICEDISYTSIESLRVHLKRTHADKNFSCRVENCSQAYAYQCDLNRHLERSHKNK